MESRELSEKGGAGDDGSTALIKNLSEPGGSGVRLQPQASSDIDSQKSKTSEKVQKRVFAPTIPTSRRIKNKASDVKEQPKQRESKLPASEKKGKRRERKDVIKSQSVFSMGPAGKSTPGHVGISSGRSSSSGGGGGSSGGGGGGSSTVTFAGSIDPAKEAVRGDSTSVVKMHPEEDEVAVLTSQALFEDSQLPPFQLPLDCASSPYQPKELTGNNVKDEPNTPVVTKGDLSLTAGGVLTTAGHTQNRSYLFMQLPDCLPVSVEPDENAGDKAQNSFSGVHEGRIGKLRIHKSGKVSLALGTVSLDVSLGTQCGFLQEVVCIRSSSPDHKMTSVGHLSHRLICTPDFESIREHT